jgi:hypothetical protein
LLQEKHNQSLIKTIRGVGFNFSNKVVGITKFRHSGFRRAACQSFVLNPENGKAISNKIMKITTFFCLCLFLSIATAVCAQSPVEAIVAAENAFADFAAANGTRSAFLEFAADDGLVFGAKPENAKEVWSKRNPASPVLLNWRPVWADSAASGEIGYTSHNFPEHKSRANRVCATRR